MWNIYSICKNLAAIFNNCEEKVIPDSFITNILDNDTQMELLHNSVELNRI